MASFFEDLYNRGKYQRICHCGSKRIKWLLDFLLSMEVIEIFYTYTTYISLLFLGGLIYHPQATKMVQPIFYTKN